MTVRVDSPRVPSDEAVPSARTSPNLRSAARTTRGHPSHRAVDDWAAQLRDRTDGWTWRPDPGDQPPSAREVECDSPPATGAFIRAFAWARILIG